MTFKPGDRLRCYFKSPYYQTYGKIATFVRYVNDNYNSSFIVSWDDDKHLNLPEQWGDGQRFELIQSCIGLTKNQLMNEILNG